MISVEFRSVSAGTCSWCRRARDEIFNVAFSDKSFVGPLCRNDLMRAIGMKVTPDPKPAPAAIPVGNGPAIAK